MIKMKETATLEINNQAQAEYFEKWQKSMEKSMKEMCERVNKREQEEIKRMTEMKESVLFSCWTYKNKQVRKLV